MTEPVTRFDRPAPVLETRNLAKRYSAFTAVRDMVPLVLGSIWLANQRRLRDELRDGERESGLAFDNPLDPAMERLKLFDE